MRHFFLCLLVLVHSTVSGFGDEGDAALRALEARVKKAASEAGPGIVRIYVSRSDAYHKAPYWGVPANVDEPGKLGRFDAVAAIKAVPSAAPQRSRLLRTIREHDLSDPNIVPESYGSGIILDRLGLVLTNAHVVRNATRIYVRIPGKRGSWADIHASDPRSDLAVLRLLDPPADLKALSLGEGGSVRRGQYVLCMANPFAPGFRGDDSPTVTSGMIRSLRRQAPGNTNEMERSKVTLHHYGTLLEMAATVTPGCSGAALLDLNGKVIGITTALAGLASDGPGGFAIPFDASTRRIIAKLRAGEEVEYGFLGVILNNGEDRLGVRLYRVSPGTPAALAGLEAGQYIYSINGVPVRRNNDLFLLIGMALAGSTVRLEVGRPGNGVRTVSVTLAKFYVPGAIIASKRPPAKFGLRVDFTSILSQRNPFPLWSRAPGEGVVVREVVPGSPADRARLQPDKLITHVDGVPVPTPAKFYERMALTGSRVELTFLNSEGRPERITLENK